MSVEEFLACVLTAVMSVACTGFLARTGLPLFPAVCLVVAFTMFTAWALLTLAQ